MQIILLSCKLQFDRPPLRFHFFNTFFTNYYVPDQIPTTYLIYTVLYAFVAHMFYYIFPIDADSQNNVKYYLSGKTKETRYLRTVKEL